MQAMHGRTILKWVLLLGLLGACSWSSGQRGPQLKIPDPQRCGPTGLACGAPSEELCCDGQSQLCCPGPVKSYCAASCE